MDEPPQFSLFEVVGLNSGLHSDLTCVFDGKVPIRSLLIGQGDIYECSLTAVEFKRDL